MKNFAIKKVALGLLLAGYVASSTFAAQSATTAVTIQGNAPTIANGASPAVANSITAIAPATNAGGAGTVSSVNDKIEFSLTTVDADGDTASATKGSLKNLQVMYYKLVSGTWTWVPSAAGAYSAVTLSGGVESMTFTLGVDAAGATKIGYVVQAETQFGDPDVGGYLSGDSLTATAPGTGSTPGGGTGTGTGPGVTGPTIPIITTSMKFAIFINGTGTAYATGDTVSVTDNYTITSTHPKLGDTYQMVYWDDANANNAIDAGEAIYPVTVPEWYANGGNTAAHGLVAAGTDYALVALTSDPDMITIPTTNANALSSTWSALPSTSEAGVQGFTLEARSTN